MSMVGRKFLGVVGARLREAFPENSDKPFGCVCVCMVGDFGQLPPVMDMPMFSTLDGPPLSLAGKAAFMSFKKAVVLNIVQRAAEDVPFQKILGPIPPDVAPKHCN